MTPHPLMDQGWLVENQSAAARVSVDEPGSRLWTMVCSG